jgi:hypothetical protein
MAIASFLSALFLLSAKLASGEINPNYRLANPFPQDGSPPYGFEAPCRSEKTFNAKQYVLAQLDKSWKPAVNEILGDHQPHPHPGGWEDGERDGGDSVVIMEYADVPTAVRDWILEQYRARKADGTRRWWLFGIAEKPREGQDAKFIDPAESLVVGEAEGGMRQELPDKDKVLMFAPRALYEILPLWVAKKSSCEGKFLHAKECHNEIYVSLLSLTSFAADFLNLAKYDDHAEEGGVVAWPMERTPPNVKDNDPSISFKIRAYLVVETEETKEAKKVWENILRASRRQNRKAEREERRRARDEL